MMNSLKSNWALLELFHLEPTRSSVMKWPEELREKRKKELHCKRMARFRGSHATEAKNMQKEFKRLEKELAGRIAHVQVATVSRNTEGLTEMEKEMQKLVVEREVLREEDVSLRKRIAQLLNFQQLVKRGNAIASRPVESKRQENQVTVSYINSRWQPVQTQAGSWTHFPNGSPSFFFHPFSQCEFNDIIHRYSTNISIDPSKLTRFGQFLGWSVHYAATRPGKQFVINHARFSKRLNRSVDTVRRAMIRPDGSSVWPILPDSKDVGLDRVVHTQTVQQLDENSSVIYLSLIHQSESEMVQGKRVFKFAYAIADSKENRRSRKADTAPHGQVRWITDEGGYSLTLPQVDEMAVDAQFDSLACLSDDQHTCSHFIMFGQIATRWEQHVMASGLLKF